MRAFVAVAELKGFAAAGRQLGSSPPAITRAIAALEQHLSIRLLHRTTRSVTLTDAGARFLERARRILSDLDEAERAARAEHSHPSGRMVVAAPNVFGRREVAPLLSDFLLRYPDVRAELILSDRMVNLIEEGVDVAVRIGALEDSSLRLRQVGATRRVVVASPKLLKKNKAIRSPRDLSRLPTIQFLALNPLPEWRFVRRGSEERVAILPVLVTNDAEAAIAHAVRGAGLAMVLSYQVVKELKEGTLEVLLPRFEPPPLPIQIVFPGTRLLSANVRAFIDLTIATRKFSFL
jgi:DNA-binding transcriptional LysR family regulator